MRKSPTLQPRRCTDCGKTYIPRGCNQRFCPDCKIVHTRQSKKNYERRKYPNRKPKQKSNEVCCVCGAELSAHFEGRPYCNVHYLRMYTTGTTELRGRKRRNSYDVRDGITIVTTSSGRTFTVDTIDLPAVQRYSWCYSKTGYLVANINGKVTKLHRFLLEPEPGVIVDHINGDPSDNRRCNLRLCSAKDNSRNTKATYSSKTGVVGVKVVPSGKFVAQIMVNRKMIILGTFDTLQAAAEARKRAEQLYFGEFAPSISRTSTSTHGNDA